MKYPAFSVRDVKAGFGQPILSLNEATMIRTFAKDINTPGSIYKFAATDYSLYQIGEFDTESGSFNPILPRFIVEGAEVLEVNHGNQN